jgi:putative colanic acid biosynthesis UDP-glucose lipid carrier transferase
LSSVEIQVKAGLLRPRIEGGPRRSVRSARLLFLACVRLGDAGVVALAGLIAAWMRFGIGRPPALLLASLLLGTLLAARILPLFRVYDLRRIAQPYHQLPRLLSAWLITVCAVLGLLYAIRASHEVSRLWIGYWLLVGAIGLAASRLLLLHPLVRGKLDRLRYRLAVVGEAGQVDACLERLDPEKAAAEVELVVRLGQELPIPTSDLDRLEQRLAAREVEQVILASANPEGVIVPVFRRLRHLPIELAWAPPALGRATPVLGATALGGQPLVRLLERPIDGERYLVKEVLDRCLAALGLVALAPVLLAVAAAVKLSSPGPVLYRQRRCGFNREPITVYKFRSMYVDRCDRPDAEQVRQATRGDARVTSVGRVLRRTSLDELPQLVNVLKGEMSLVGPRPHAVAHDTLYSRLIDNYLSRHRVKPGLTGWAQVNGHRGETDTLEKMRARIEHDLYYIENWSLLFDIRIIAKTVLAVFSGPNAR